MSLILIHDEPHDYSLIIDACEKHRSVSNQVSVFLTCFVVFIEIKTVVRYIAYDVNE